MSWNSYSDNIDSLAFYARDAMYLLEYLNRVSKAGKKPGNKAVKEAGRIARRLRETLERA